MAARILDGTKIAAEIRAEVTAQAKALALSGVRPGLAVVLVGHNPASEVYVRGKVKSSRGGRPLQRTTHAPRKRDHRRTARPDRRSEPPRRNRRHPGAVAAARARRCQESSAGGRSRQRRGRLPSHERGLSFHAASRPGALHAGRRHGNSEAQRDSGRRAGSRGRRTQRHCRQARSHAAAESERHRHRLPLEDARPARSLPPRRHPGGGDWPRRHGHPRLREARSHRDRRRHQPDHRPKGIRPLLLPETKSAKKRFWPKAQLWWAMSTPR